MICDIVVSLDFQKLVKLCVPHVAAVLKRVQSYRLELLRRDELGYLSAGERLLSYRPQLAVFCEGHFFKAAALRERIAFYFLNALGHEQFPYPRVAEPVALHHAHTVWQHQLFRRRLFLTQT